MPQDTSHGAASGESVVIRRATIDDATAMSALANAAYAVYLPRRGDQPLPVPMTVDYFAVVRQAEAWVAQLGGAIVGLLVLYPLEDHLLLDNIAVSPERQGIGLGARLLALADERSRDLQLPEIRLYTNVVMTENLAYYPRHGYRETHRTTCDGYHRVFFTKHLAPPTPATQPPQTGAEP